MQKITYKVRYKKAGRQMEKFVSKPSAVALAKLYGKQKGFEALRAKEKELKILPTSSLKKSREFGLDSKNFLANRFKKPIRLVKGIPDKILPLTEFTRKRLRAENEERKKRKKEFLLKRFRMLKKEKKASVPIETIKGLPKATKIVLGSLFLHVPKYLFNKVVYSILKRGTPSREEMKRTIKRIDDLDRRLPFEERNKKIKQIIIDMKLR